MDDGEGQGDGERKGDGDGKEDGDGRGGNTGAPHAEPRSGGGRREAILAAALRLFREGGFHGTGVAAIGRAAGVSPGHLYHYFPSKEAMVEAIVEGDRQRVAELVRALARGPAPIEALVTALLDADGAALGLAVDAALALEILAEAARNPAVAAIQARFDAALREDLAALLASAQGAGEVDPGLDPQAAAGALLAVADGILARRISDPNHDRVALRNSLRQMIGVLLSPSS